MIDEEVPTRSAVIPCWALPEPRVARCPEARSGEAKAWLRGLPRAKVLALTAELSGGIARGKDAQARQPAELDTAEPAGGDNDRPYASPHFWAAFVLAGDSD